ncbi:MAG: serine hydrolase [Lachnospiraceae bacterium]|nr:serine hydrolase [Lachnospiraceae bacterium]
MREYKELISNPEEIGLSSSVLNNYEEVMKKAFDDKTLKGAVVLVARHGKIAHFKAYGNADEDKAMDTECMFRLASMSKMVGTVALMQLVDQGKIMISDPVSRYIPAFASKKVAKVVDDKVQLVDAVREITVHDILAMTSGIVSTWSSGDPGRDYSAACMRDAGINDAMHDLDLTLEEYINLLAPLPLAAQPGEIWEYSNSSMLTVARIVEIVSGLPLDEYLQKNIFEPLGMEDTAFFPSKEKWDRFPYVYAAGTGEKLTELDVPGTDDTRVPFGTNKKFFNCAGGLMGTTYDYFRFAQMLLNGGELDGVRIISRHAVELISMNHVGSKRDQFYGHAWGYMANVQEEYNTTFNYMGNGSWGWHGYWGTVFNIYPQKDMLTIFMSQCSPEPPSWKIQEQALSVASSAVLD